jgi:hypothetical protein
MFEPGKWYEKEAEWYGVAGTSARRSGIFLAYPCIPSAFCCILLFARYCEFNSHWKSVSQKINEPKPSFWARRTLLEHPGILVSGLYFVASVVGLVYSWAFFRSFEINVFHYAEISDFLLASLKEPFTWVVAIFALAMTLYDNAMSRRVQAGNPWRLFRWYGTERYRLSNYLGLVVVIVFFLITYAEMQGKDIRDGEGETVSVFLTDGSPPKHLMMLGTTGKFIFLYDHVAERVDIHPHESILTITKSTPDSRKE